MEEEQLLKWNNHGSHMLHAFKLLRRSDRFSDVTLFSDGKFFMSHKIVLSACSDYFDSMLGFVTTEKPIIFLDLNPLFVSALLDYMYMGQVQIKASDVSGFLDAAQKLKIKGLWIDPKKDEVNNADDDFQRKLQLGLVHSEFLSNQFAPRPPHPLVNNNVKTFNRRTSRSPPCKRKRSSPVLKNAATVAATITTGSVDSTTTADIPPPPPYHATNAVLCRSPPPASDLTEDRRSVNDERSADEANTSDVNPLPLVKIEMEEGSATEEEETTINSCTADSGHQLKMEAEAEIKDPLVTDSDEGGATDAAPGSSTAAACTAIHEYLQQKHYQPKQDDEADDDGDVSSDDADLPVLVVNEDGVDMAQNFECPHCQAKLANANLLRRHIEDSHKQMRKHFCTTCDKAFKRKEHLERHLRIHTGIKPFICTICQTKFTQKEHLKGHIDNVHLKKKTALRRNAKIAPAGASLKSLNTSTSEALNVAQESKFLLSNGPRPGAFANGTTTSVNVMGIQNNDSFSRGGKNPLMPRTSESGMEEMNSHGGLLGRMVGSSGVVNSIGGAMNSNLSTALSLLAATASAVAPHLNTTSSSDVHAKDEHHLPSSRDSSPPSLTSPTSLAMSRGTPPHFSTPSFAGSIFPTHSFANIMLPNSSNSTTLFSTLASVSPLNSVFTANLPNTTFSTSTSAAFPSQEDGAIVKELRTNSSPSSRGSGRGRGRGVALARRKTSKLPRISLGRGPELTSPPALSPSPTPTTASSQNNGGPSNLHVAGPHVTPVYSHVTRKSLSSPEKHIKKVVLKYL